MKNETAREREMRIAKEEATVNPVNLRKAREEAGIPQMIKKAYETAGEKTKKFFENDEEKREQVKKNLRPPAPKTKRGKKL